MSERRPPESDGLEQALEAWMDTNTSSPGSPCPDANDLVAFASGVMLDAEREPVEIHLAACRDCRAAVAAAVRADDAAPVESTPAMSSARSASWIWLAAAAAVLVITIGVAVAAWPPATGPSETAPSAEEALAREVARLAASHPDLFGDFTPLSKAERLARGDALERGSAVLLAPAGAVLETQPSFIWRSPDDAVATIVISTDDGVKVARGDGVSSPWSPAERLERGRTYLVEIEVEGVLGPERSSRTFRVASDELTARYRKQRSLVEAEVPAPLRELVLAQLALRSGLLIEGHRHAAAYVSLSPETRIGRETLFRAMTLTGHPDAADILEAP